MTVDCEICCICGEAELRGSYCSSRVQNDSDSDNSDSDDENCHGFFCRSCDNGKDVQYCPSCEFEIKCKNDINKHTILELVDKIKALKVEYNNMLPIVKSFRKTEDELKMYREILRLKKRSKK